MKTLWLAVLLAAPRAHAAPGTTGANFVRVQTSPRAAGMGEAGTAAADDLLTAVSLNPAGLGRLAYSEGAFVYNQYFEDLTMQHAAFARPTASYGTFALAGTLFRSETFPGYDNSGVRSTDVRARDFSVSASYALRLAGAAEDRRLGLFAGVSATYAKSLLDTASANSSLVDVGFLYAGPLGPGVWSAATSARSLGSGPLFDSRHETAPTVYRAGLGYTLPIFGDPLTAVWDLRRPNDETFSNSVGLEWALKRLLFWRVGYASNSSMGSGFRAGVGLKIKFFTVDYALSESGNFGITHLIGLSTRFGEPIERTPAPSAGELEGSGRLAKGRAFLKAGRAYDAAVEFSEALRADPHNAEALRLLRQVREQLDQAK